MKAFMVVTLFWLSNSCRGDGTVSNVTIIPSCDGSGICTYAFPIPVNITVVDFAAENATLLYIHETISSLTTNLTNAFNTFTDNSTMTTTNLTRMNDTINNLNDMIDNLATLYTSDLQPTIATLTSQINDLNSAMDCFETCTTTNVPTTTTLQTTTRQSTAGPTTTANPTTQSATRNTQKSTTVSSYSGTTESEPTKSTTVGGHSGSTESRTTESEPTKLTTVGGHSGSTESIPTESTAVSEQTTTSLPTTTPFDLCLTADCGEGTCVWSSDDPATYSCQCPICFSGDNCQNNLSNNDPCCATIGGNDFCVNSGQGGYCYWPCQGTAPICSTDNPCVPTTTVAA